MCVRQAMLNASSLFARFRRRYWPPSSSVWLEVLKALGVTALYCGVTLAVIIILIHSL